MVQRFKQYIKKEFSLFVYFYQQLGYKMFLVLGLSVLIGFLDAFGLVMFIPLLQLAEGSSNVEAGNFEFLINFCEKIGIEITVYKVILFLIFIFLIKGFVVYGANLYTFLVQRQLSKDVRIDLVKRVSRYRYDKFVSMDIGRVQNVFVGEITKLNYTFVNYIKMLQAILMVLVYLFFSFLVDSKFALLICVGGILSNFVFSGINKQTAKKSKRITVVGNEFARLVTQYINNFKYLKASGYVSQYEKFLTKGIEQSDDESYRLKKLTSIILSFKEPILVIVVCIVMAVQIAFFNGKVSDMMVSLLFMFRALMSIAVIQNCYTQIVSNQGSIDNIFDFKSDLSKGIESDGTLQFDGLKNAIEMNNLSYSYDQNTQVLKNVSLRIQNLSTVAFIGESGSGKTTLVNILTKLLRVPKGTYTLDGIDVNDIKTNSLQNEIGYISQESNLFNDTIFNNITFWEKKSPENVARVYEVIKKVSLLDFIEEQSEGLDTLIDNNGLNLSGGQRQRIAIARELYKNASILILDEATSALDSETEKEIQQNIDQLKGLVTVVIIAHRLSTIKNVDTIYLLDRGEVKDHGDFSELLQKSDKFRKMVEIQEI